MNIRELREQVDARAVNHVDFYASQSSFRFDSDRMMFGGDVKSAGELTDWAYGQVLGRLQAPPKAWMKDRCPYDLHNHILNTLAQEREDAKLMVRMDDINIRAVLSDQYTPFDSEKFIPMVEQACDTLGTDVKVIRPYIGDALRAYLLMPAITFAPDPGLNPSSFYTSMGADVYIQSDIWSRIDAAVSKLGVAPVRVDDKPRVDIREQRDGSQNGGLHPAIYIANNEIGGGGIRVQPAVYRNVCDNGLIYGWSERTEGYFVRHRWINESVMANLVATAIAESFEMSEAVALAFIQTMHIPVEVVSLKPLVERWTTKYGITVSTKDNWLSAIQSESAAYGRAEDIRAFDVVNAATLVAQRRDVSPDEREMVERMAGDLVANYVPVSRTEE